MSSGVVFANITFITTRGWLTARFEKKGGKEKWSIELARIRSNLIKDPARRDAFISFVSDAINAELNEMLQDLGVVTVRDARQTHDQAGRA